MDTGLSLVTGGAGFIGRHLVEHLLIRGERVRVLDIDAAPGDLGADVEVRQGSVLDAAGVQAALKGARRLYHLAGNADLWARHKSDFNRINVEGTRVVLDAAARAGLERIVITSSETVLRNGQAEGAHNGRAVKGDLLSALRSMAGAYSRSKLLADWQAQEAARHGLPAVIVYPTLPIGAGDRHLTPPTRMLLAFLRGRAPAYYDCELNLVAVEDVARGHILAAEKGRIGGRYVLCGENIAMHEILAILEEVSGRRMPRRKIPYWLALAIAAASEFISDHISHRPPLASLEGVRLAHSVPLAAGHETLEELGLTRTSVREALTNAIVWLRASGLAAA